MELAQKEWTFLPFKNEGNSAVEFAVAAPLFLLLIMAIIDFSRMMITDSMLQTALGSLVSGQRYLQSQQGETVSEAAALVDLKEILALRGAGWIDSDRIELTIIPQADPISAGAHETDQKILLFKVSYVFSYTTPFVDHLLGTELLIRESQLILWSNIE